MSLDLNNNIYSNIASQFPSIYREEGSFLVDFIEAYYQHLDAKMDRDIPKLKDIDTTLTTFLIYYKKKYLSDLPIDTVVDTRFIVKHITDIYKRKGTQEALELVFRLFFDEDIEVFYPSGSILRPSDSIFGGDAYLEMYPVFTSDGYPVKKGDKLVGSVSLASAFVDEILFVNFSGSLCPIVYLSNLSGSFTSDDSLTRTRDTVSTIIGKLVRGSVSNVAINNLGRLPNQKVGDKIKISSSAGGIGASGLVTEISTAETGTISFSVVDGGFGYADPLTSSASNSIGISNQVLIVGGTVTQNIKIGDIVTTYKQNILNNDSSVAVASGMTGSAVVIAYAHPLLYVKTQATSLSATDTNNRITQLNKSYTSGVGIGSNILKTELARIVSVNKPLLPEVENAYTKTVSIQNDFDSSTTIVAASTDQITIPLHGFVDKGTVTYTATGTALSPLVDGTSYFIKVNSDNTVSLYDSLANATNGDETGRQNFTTTTINNATGSHRLTGTRIVGDLAAAGSINAAAIGVLDAYFLYVENASYPSDNAGVLGSLTATQKKYLETIALPELGIFDQFTTLSTAQKSSFVVNHSSDEITFNSTSNYNVSASYTIGSIKDSETVTLIIDQVGDFAGVVLNAGDATGGNDGFGDDDDYGMSGAGSESLGTTLRDAFTPITLTIGSIDSLITKQGLNYTNDVFSNIENSTILKFDKRDIVFSFDPNLISSLAFSVGDLITQEIQLENILNVDITTIIVQKSGVGDSYPSVPTLSQSGGNTIPYTAKAKFLKRAGNNFYFRQMSFYDFDESIDAKTDGGATIGITAIARDPDSRPMGGNATIQGEATYSTGQISKVKVENTGYKFADREIVDIINDELVSASYGTVVAKATVRSLGTGKTEGTWKSSTSFLSDSTKRLADNDYYQEYSYDISSSVEKNRYSGLIKEVAGVAGTKLFSSSLVGSTESLDIDIDSAMDAFYSKTFIFEQQDSPVVLSTPLSTVNFTNSTGTISFAAYDISASFRLAVTGATNGASITGYTGATISNVQVSGTAGEFTCDATTLVVGQVIRITETGTLSGTGDISGGTGIYRVNAVSGSAGSVTGFTLGIISIVDYTRITPIGSVAGTTTGLTFESGELYAIDYSSVSGGTEGLRTGLTLQTLAYGAVATSTNSNSQLDITPMSTTQDLLLASSTSTPLTTVVIGGTTGQFTCDAAALAVGQKIAISGTYGGTGSITGYSNPTTYIITAITGTSPSITGFTLKTTSGVALTTSTGTPTGLTYTPLVDDVHMGGIVNIPNTSTRNRELSFTELSSAYEVGVSDEASRSTRTSASSNGVASAIYDPATAYTLFSSAFDVSNGYNSIVGYTNFLSADDPGTFEDRVDIDFTSHGDRKNWIGYDTLSINVSTRDSTPGWEFGIEVTDGTTTLASPFVDLPAYVSTNPEYIKTATLDMKNTLINRSSITKVTLVFRGTLPVNGTDTSLFSWRVWSEGSPVTGDIPAYINSVS